MNHEINEDEVFEKKESKIKPKLKEIFGNKKVIVTIIVVIMLVILAVLEFTMGIFSNLIYGRAGIGNTIGNIINCGYSAEKGEFIYYVAPSEDMQSTNIYRVKKGTSEYETLFTGSYDIRALNIVGNQLYFISISNESSSDEDGIDNKIYKMNLDGSNATVINDNDFAYDYYDMYAVNNNLYYVGTDYNVYKMDLKGGNRKLVAQTETGFLAINEKYIIYNKENEEGSDYITYVRKLNGTEEKPITGSRINTPILEGDFIYYINSNQVLAKIPIDGGEEEVILDNTVYNMNLANGFLYYLNYKDEQNEDYTISIYRLNINGGEPELIKDFSYYSSFLNIVGDYAYYMDMDEEKAFINLVNVQDKSEIQLYEWNYEEHSHDEVSQ